MKILKMYSIIVISILIVIFISFSGINTTNAQNLTINGIDTTMYGEHTFENVELNNGAVIYVDTYASGTQKGKLVLRAKNIKIDGGSSINANGKGGCGLSLVGHGGGAGHGGKGGDSNHPYSGGNIYGDEFGNYTSIGSDGGAGYDAGGKGGGAILLYCNTLILNGNLTANGINGKNGGDFRGTGGGGGSGGGILINCKSLLMTGSLCANGGDGGYWYGGGAGGGRIKIIYVSKNIIGTISAKGGPGSSATGGQNGTIWYNAYPTTPNLISPPSNRIQSNKPIFRLISTDNDSTNFLFYKIEISTNNFTSNFNSYNQSLDPQGWSKTKYVSGDTAMFISPDIFPNGHYYWRAYAFDGYVWSDGWKIDNPVPSVIGEFDVQSTSVTENPHQPIEYQLNQNYPNPFNPSTTIEYSIPHSTHVVLKIYDVLGKEVATLVDEELPMGQHKVNWNAQHLASGVYVYKIQAGEFVETKKMLLMR